VRLLHVFSTFNLGGPQARFLAQVRDWGSKYEHHVIAMDNKFGAMEFGDRSLIKTVPLEKIERSRGLGNRGLVKKTLDVIKPDVLLTYNWGAIDWVAHAPKKIRRMHVEEGFSAQEALEQLPRRRWFRWLIFKLKKPQIVVVSRSMQKIAKKTWGLSDQYLEFIPNGIDETYFTREGTKTRLSDENSPFRFGTVAGLRPEKRIDRLIRCFADANIPNSHLAIAGQGDEEKKLKTLIKELHLEGRVELLGHLNDPAQLLKAIDCYVLVSATEQAPLSLLEAMSCGLPCIVTAVGDMPFILDEVSEPWIAQNSSEGITKSLAEVVKRADLYEKGEKNRARVISTFNFRKMQDHWDQMILSV
jgi:glycosyltransferase involved in cell wall biosynthesis